MNAKTTISRALVALPLSAALAGCVSFGPKTPDTLLTLRPTSTPAAGTSASGSLATALVVLEPSAEARVAVTRVPVQIDDANVAYLKKALWVDRPTRQFQRLLAETIRAKGGRLVIENDPGGNGTQVSGRLLDMGYDARTRMAVVRFDAIRTTGGKVDTRRFESMVPVADAEAKYVGPALNEAANVVAQAVAEWVG